MTRAYRPVHKASDKIEPRLARAFIVASERLRERIPFRQIEDALAAGDIRRANNILTRFPFEDAYLPSAEILKESVLKGAKIASEED
jgi:hypothetical protein